MVLWGFGDGALRCHTLLPQRLAPLPAHSLLELPNCAFQFGFLPNQKLIVYRHGVVFDQS